MADILTDNKKGLKLFVDGVIINEELPKWKNLKTVNDKKTGNTYIINQQLTGTSTETPTVGTPISIWTNNQEIELGEPFDEKGVEVGKLSEVASLGLRELNQFVKDQDLRYTLTKTGRWGNNYVTLHANQIGVPTDKKLSFWERTKQLFSAKKEDVPEMDAVQFFTHIKATTKESANGYVNRIERYLKALHNAKIVGQTALVEQLTREMIANTYESFLAAEGYYHVVTEQQVIDFAKKSERGISIDYVKNYVRPIPEDIIEKIGKADKLEVFDNYVIMHYDPKGVARHDTVKEEIKRRDPIVFGIIAGSTKLYYIADWVDEYCDLTLEKFVDTLKISKDDLITDKVTIEEMKAAKAKEIEERLKQTAQGPGEEKPKRTRKKKGE